VAGSCEQLMNVRVSQNAGYSFTTSAAVSFLKGNHLNGISFVLETTTSNGGINVSVTILVIIITL
jgi:hypothetical protein